MTAESERPEAREGASGRGVGRASASARTREGLGEREAIAAQSSRGLTISRTTYTPLDWTTNEMSAAVIVTEYTAPLSMMTRRTGVKMLLERYCADLRATFQILNASSTARKGKGHRVRSEGQARAKRTTDDQTTRRGTYLLLRRSSRGSTRIPQ